MGRALTNKANVDNADTDYPRGRIKDDDGTQNGTYVDEDVYGDLHQVTEQMAADAAVNEPGDSQLNERPDNSANGYQFYQAVRKNAPYASIYESGRFTEALANTGDVDTVVDCCVFDGELYVADSGDDTVAVYELFDGLLKRTIGGGDINGILGIQVIPDGGGGGLLYVCSNTDGEVRVFNAGDGTYIPASNITTVITDPRAIFIDLAADRIYTLDPDNNRVEVHILSTQVNQGGESFDIAADAGDLAVMPHKDRIYVLITSGGIDAHDIAGAPVPGDDIAISSPLKMHFVGDTVYVIDNGGSTFIAAFSDRDQAAKTWQNIPNTLTGAVNNLFIRHGVLYLCSTNAQDVLPIVGHLNQEYS